MVAHPDKPKTKAFDEWANDKTPLIRMAAFAIAGSPQEFLEFMQMMKVGKRIEGYIYLPPIRQWLKLYRNHRRLHRTVAALFKSLNEECASIINFYELLVMSVSGIGKMTNEELKKEIENTPPEAVQEILSVYREGEELLKKCLIEDESEEEKPLADQERKRFRQMLQTPEMIFFLRVWFPCFLLYGTYPPYLLRKARQGDDDALEKLLRLDKSIIDDPKIREMFHQAAVAKQRGKMDLIAKALAKPPKAKINIQTIKYTQAGLISLISNALGQRMQAAEIHRLYDALAADAGKGAIDEDLIVSPETFEKAIQRARSFWQIPHLSDKK